MSGVSVGDPDSKVHEANMGPIWGRQDPGGPHVGPMKLAIWRVLGMLKLANGQLTDNSPVAVRSLSIPNPFYSVVVYYFSGARVVHIRSYPSSICVPRWRITNGYVTDTKTDKWNLPHKYHMSAARGEERVGDGYRLNSTQCKATG